MIDMTDTIQSKSEQLNAEDLIAGPITIKITAFKKMASKQQPIHIEYEGGEGRPYKPNLSMRKAIAIMWGGKFEEAGRSMTLFNEPTVLWKGKEEGGIRISHLSHIEKGKTISLIETRGKKFRLRIEPLTTFAGNPLPPETLELWKQEIERAETMADLQGIGLRVATNKYDEAGSLLIRTHYQAAQERIRTDVDPKNLDSPPDESLEGGEDVPGL
jgi:hypothetical protein